MNKTASEAVRFVQQLASALPKDPSVEIVLAPPFTALESVHRVLGSASHLALARGDAEQALALRRRVARAHPEDWRYWLLAGEAAVRAGDCPDLAESIGRLGRLAPPAAARRTSALST